MWHQYPEGCLLNLSTRITARRRTYTAMSTALRISSSWPVVYPLHPPGYSVKPSKRIGASHTPAEEYRGLCYADRVLSTRWATAVVVP